MYQTYQNFTDAGDYGLEGMFLYASEVVPIFIPLMLFALFMIITLATFFSQKRLTGKGDFSVSMITASFITVITASILSLIPNLINPLVLITCIAVFIASIIILFLTRE